MCETVKRKPGRPPKPGVSRHLHIDPYVWVMADDATQTVDGDARMDRFLQWFDSQPNKRRTDAVMRLLVAAVNGELEMRKGAMVDASAEEMDAARLAAEDIMAAFVVG